MYWTLELASKLEDAPWPATKEELIDGVEIGGVGTYLGDAEESNVNLFI